MEREETATVWGKEWRERKQLQCGGRSGERGNSYSVGEGVEREETATVWGRSGERGNSYLMAGEVTYRPLVIYFIFLSLTDESMCHLSAIESSTQVLASISMREFEMYFHRL